MHQQSHKDARIIFMGTPDFAVASLDALVQNGFNIVGVITAPDKPAGRGMKFSSSAVKNYAVEKGLHILQPEKLKNPAFLEELRALRADLQVVVAFRMLPELVWNMPPLGTINVHASLLPKYRGAAPINWAIINGEKETGITTFKLTHEIDTGNILLQEKVSIGEDTTAGDLHETLKVLGASVLVKTVTGLLDNSVKEQPQPVDNVIHAPKIFTETCRINWQRSTLDVYNMIRGLSPHPGAFTEVSGKTFKIFLAEKKAEPHQQSPGTLDSDYRTFMRFACADGYIYPTLIQSEGKKRMPVTEFLKGFRPASG